MHMHFARKVLWQRLSRGPLAWRLTSRSGFGAFCLAHFQLFQLQLQLLDLACDLLALGAKHHAPQLRDDELEVFDLAVAAEQLLLLCKDECCERLSV
jgi:hypothetical protein